MRITYLAAVSADGFIARENGDVTWLDALNIDMSQTGLDAFFQSVDGLVMGRRTYDFVFEYGSWPYEKKPAWVCTHSDTKLMEGAELIVVSDIATVIRDAANRNFNHLWLVGGGRLASAFLDAGLLTHLSISEMPVELGTGIALFSGHRWQEIPVQERTVVMKNGYRQHELLIQGGNISPSQISS
jgi:dihydrofolate reductase